ncbi:BTAD domain-containing putative transcriptional regulator [Streptomyces sp. NPDC048639]|uniref:BTAD domain-containing putative transcriptional regulator n=1 Tax=Streptomyces sp. NPDC048639 TaxID=3365581 RepID=UPI00371B5FAB
MTVDFAILGPLEIRCGGRPLPIRSRPQRALLSRLLLAPGRIVSREGLIDSVWTGEAPPGEPVAALQNHLSRLRAHLGPSRSVLVTHTTGYALDVPQEHVDSVVFERLVGEARRVKDADPHAALRLLDRAGSLWRGPALGEFADGFARPRAVALEHLRVAADEERVELLLATGDVSAALATAESLTAQEPLREWPYALRMRALACRGRVEEALSAYQELRGRLAGELGIEPSAELRELHVRLLRGEAGPARPARQPEPATPPAPESSARVPVALSSLVGRKPEIDEVRSAVSRSRLVTLTGPGGVGKTRLGMEAAALLDRPPSTYWIELASLGDPRSVAAAVLDALDVPDPPADGPLDGLVSVLSGRQALLILDNCEHVVAGVAEVAERVLRHCPGIRILATSRERLAVEGEEIVAVPPLSVARERGDSEAARLLADRMRSAGHRPVEEDDRTRRQIQVLAERVDGLPLALELAAVSAASLGLEAALGAADPLEMTDGRRSGAGRHHDLRCVLTWSHGLLTEEERIVFRRLSVFPGWFSVAWAQEVCADEDLAADRIAHVLASLVGKSLVVHRSRPLVGDRQHALLSTVGQFAAEQLAAAGEEPALREAHARYTLGWMSRAAQSVGTGDGSQFALLSGCSGDLRAARAWAYAHDRAASVALPSVFGRYAFARTDFEILGWAEEEIGRHGPPHPPLSPDLYGAAALAAIGRADLRLAERRAQEAVALASTELEALHAHAVLANCLLFRGHPKEAADLCVRGWTLAREVGDVVTETEYAGLGTITTSYAGDWTRCRTWIERGWDCARRLPSPLVTAYAAYFSGAAKIPHLPEEALAELTHSHDIASRIGAYFLSGVALTSLVTLQTLPGRRTDPVERLTTYARALRHWRDTGNRTHLWITLRHLIPVLSDLEEDESAVRLHHLMAARASAPHSYQENEDAFADAVERSRRRVGRQRTATTWPEAATPADDTAVELALTAVERQRERLRGASRPG